ncbi:hypothetical protein KXQ82_13930 [Mucilaginibacter sp. HMF5004]|uniref:archaemetzincin n=1 Tax=Mucilaginibacter rivuli TaxID=2857527 RepID=UPI001C5FE29F|nr:archaemetzincin [Mucilaginibacter rivuli]MBW4890826.1 hypothetical protein [Mucilaginibacter rivuli]
MKNALRISFILLMLMVSFSCHHPHANRVVIIQPFTYISPSLIATAYKKIQETIPKTILRKAIPLPTSTYYASRNRYRADSIIKYLDHFGSADTVVIGLTSKDISTTKGNMHDWGIMGLGYEPGNACVVSTFRLSKTNTQNQFSKVVLHELGHTQGLPHCPNKTCFMCDAGGGNHLDDEIGFCPNCKAYLKGKGWNLD